MGSILDWMVKKGVRPPEKWESMTEREFDRIDKRFDIAKKAILNEQILINECEKIIASNEESSLNEKTLKKLRRVLIKARTVELRLYNHIKNLINHAKYIASKVLGKAEIIKDIVKVINIHNTKYMTSFYKFVESCELPNEKDVLLVRLSGLKEELNALNAEIEELEKEEEEIKKGKEALKV